VTTADYALIVSIFSAVVALAGFGWNVWSKFIYPKAKVRVTFYTCVVMNVGPAPPWPQFLCLSAANFGPTDVTLQSVGIVISRGFGRMPQHALVNPIHDIFQPDVGVGPFAGGLPKKLAVGESHSAYFPFNAQSFARDNLTRVSFFDNFSRSHRVSMRQVRKVKIDLEKEFWQQPYASELPPEPASNY
jgi:hypothetical protein